MSGLAGFGQMSGTKRFLGPLIVVVLILLANGAYLTRITNPDPLGPRGNLVVSAKPGFLQGDRTIDPNNGWITQAVGREAARQVIHGHIPGWDPYAGVGSPLLASPQSAASFPPTLLQLLPNGMFLETLLLECIAGLATYALIRRLGLGMWPAVFGGVAFGLNGTFAWLQNGAMLPAAFLPLLVLGVERAANRAETGRRGGWCMIAVALALMVHAGFVETVYINGLLVATWTVWRLLVMPAVRRRSFLTKVAAGAAAGLMLSAPLLLPFASYLRVADIGGHKGMLGNAVLPIGALPTQLGLPYSYGPIFAFHDTGGTIDLVWGNVGGFLTIAVVFLAVVGLLGRRMRGLRIALAGWMALCIAKSFGPHIIVAAVNLLPRMTSVAFYRYMNPSLELAAIVLASLGMADLLQRNVAGRDLANAVIVSAALVWLAERLSATTVASVPAAGRYLQRSFGWAAAVILLMAAGSRMGPYRWRVVVLGTVAVADVIGAFSLPTLSAPRAQHIDTTAITWLRQHDGLQRYYTFGPIGPNYGSYFRVASAAITNVPFPQLWTDFVHARLGPGIDPVNLPFVPSYQQAMMAHPDVLRDLAVRYVVFSRGAVVSDPLKSELTLVVQDRLADVYELGGSKPYFDSAQTDCVMTPIDRTSVRVNCDRATTIIRREQFFPGWSASINGRPAPIVLQEGLFQGVNVPAGASSVKFSYQPDHIRAGIALAVLAVGWLAAALLGQVSAMEGVRRSVGARALHLGRTALALGD